MEFWDGWSLFFNYQEFKYENCSIFSESFFNCDRLLWLFYTDLSKYDLSWLIIFHFSTVIV